MFYQSQDVPEKQYVYEISYTDSSGVTKRHHLVGYFERLTMSKISAVKQFISALPMFEQAETIITELDSRYLQDTISGTIANMAKRRGKSLLTLDSFKADILYMLNALSAEKRGKSHLLKLVFMTVVLPLGAFQTAKGLAKYRLSQIRAFNAYKAKDIPAFMKELQFHPFLYRHWINHRTQQWFQPCIRNPNGKKVDLITYLKSQNNAFLTRILP